MNLTTNIILWTISLTLGITGILFGIIASYNSRRANNSLKELIHNTRVDDLARKFFFEHSSHLISANKKAIKHLRKNETVYFDYSIVNTGTRFTLINQENQNRLKKSSYNDLLTEFLEMKKILDRLFIKSLGEKSLLHSTKKISLTKRNTLIEYHTRVIDSATIILKTFTNGIDPMRIVKV